MQKMESMEVLSMAAALEGEALVEAEQSLRELTMRSASSIMDARLFETAEEKDQNSQDAFYPTQGSPLKETTAAKATAAARHLSSRSSLCCCIGFLLKAEETKMDAERKRLEEERHLLNSERQWLEEEKCRHIAQRVRHDAQEKLRLREKQRDAQRKAAEKEWLEQEMNRLESDRKAFEEHWTPWSAASPIWVPTAGEPCQENMHRKEAHALASSMEKEPPEQMFIHGFRKESLVTNDLGTDHDFARGLPLPARGEPDVQMHLPSEPTGQSSAASDCNGPAGTRLFRSCCDTQVSPRSRQAKPDGHHFSVDLERIHGERLGVRLDKMETTNYLIVREVLADGLVAQWNARSGQSRRIMAGDCVYRVNGVFGSGEVLLGQLGKGGLLLQLRLWRPNVKMRSKIEGLGHVDFRGSPCGRGHAAAESLAHKQRQLPNLDEDLRQSTMSTTAESAESMVGIGKEPCLSQQSTNAPSVESSVRSMNELSSTSTQSMISSLSAAKEKARILNMAENNTCTDEEGKATSIPVGEHVNWSDMRKQTCPPVVVTDLRQPIQSSRVPRSAGSSVPELFLI